MADSNRSASRIEELTGALRLSGNTMDGSGWLQLRDEHGHEAVVHLGKACDQGFIERLSSRAAFQVGMEWERWCAAGQPGSEEASHG